MPDDGYSKLDRLAENIVSSTCSDKEYLKCFLISRPDKE